MKDLFICVPLLSDIHHKEQIMDFVIDREAAFSSIQDKVVGLEAYLKRCAWNEDLNNEVRIYLVKDTRTDDIVAYFGLKAGMVSNSKTDMLSVEEQQELFHTRVFLWPHIPL